ncbi:unnamed protein product [Miscanthus lutarioriparius]|uniref:Phospholipid/glycerol acyltransferase domain-containing protein n=1 Tax=Miscanthus lutarioriparius TaxID=422564 RepID=A0A811P3B9_9POAL|nr:unnamed protein product [Miscanthus lutarioriparius]
MAAGGGAPWAERARVVGTQIRNRFRVAPVDHRSLWLRADGRVATEAVRRWSDRVRALLQRDRGSDRSSTSTETSPEAAAKPSSSALRFYRESLVQCGVRQFCTLGKEVNGIEDSVIFRSLQALAVPLIGNACYVFMHGLNSVQVYGAEKLHQALQGRPKGKALLTVSNHVAAMDDPFVIASLLPPSVMLEAQKLRWTLCATDRCFTNPVLSTFFRSVKVLPVSRGEGIYQKGMDMALSKLNSGGWVHIFPEGSRSRDGGKTIAPAKRGVGRLVMDADSLPVVIPFVHTGMQDIMPVGKRIPRAGKRVIVVVGDPISFDDLLIDNCDDTQHISRGILYDKATERIGQRLQELKVEVDRLAAEQRSELQNHNVSDDGYRLWQQVDWEGFGIGSSMLSSEPSAVQVPSKEAEPEPHLEVERSVSPAPSASTSYNVAVPHWFQRHVDPSEFMGFAARGLIKNGKFLEEGYRELQQSATTLNTWWISRANNAAHRWSTA